jgi:DNA-binding CsgD family transcriptional regulator
MGTNNGRRMPILGANDRGKAEGSQTLVAVEVTREYGIDPNLALSPNARLTRAELETLELAGQGLTNERLAAVRGVSLGTVASQLTVAYRKLGVGGRRELRARLRALPPPVPAVSLTSREREILLLVERGESNKVIAFTLGVAISTVSTILTRARRKMAPHPSPHGQSLQHRKPMPA